LDDLRNIGESSCNPGDGTVQRVQSLMLMMMMINKMHGSRRKIPSKKISSDTVAWRDLITVLKG
jgi:hypothetical protein